MIEWTHCNYTVRPYFVGGTMNILICDDEKDFLDISYLHVQEYMKNRYIPCTITATVDPVIILQSSKSFDLAFLDIQMSGADGLTLVIAICFVPETKHITNPVNKPAKMFASIDDQKGMPKWSKAIDAIKESNAVAVITNTILICGKLKSSVLRLCRSSILLGFFFELSMN